MAERAGKPKKNPTESKGRSSFQDSKIPAEGGLRNCEFTFSCAFL